MSSKANATQLHEIRQDSEQVCEFVNLDKGAGGVTRRYDHDRPSREVARGCGLGEQLDLSVGSGSGNANTTHKNRTRRDSKPVFEIGNLNNGIGGVTRCGHVRPLQEGEQRCGLEAQQAEEWTPADVHVGDVCTVMPAPHASDGGTMRPSIGVSVVNQPGLLKTDTKASACKKRKSMVRLPNVRERRQARDAGMVGVYGVKGLGIKKVCMKTEEAMKRKQEGCSIQLFDESVDVARNIKAAAKWVSQDDAADATSEAVRTDEAHEAVKLRADAKIFEYKAETKPICCNGGIPEIPKTKVCCEVGEESHGRSHVKAPELKRCQRHDEEPDKIGLRDLLTHSQISNVRSVSNEVRRRMRSFEGCSHQHVKLSLNGTTAKQIQKNLRAQLVEDLKAGNDEAAFVCSQLGIDSVPRADQLELMIAAMPGVANLVFEGPEVKSGINIPAWKEGHATHCTKGCTKEKVSDDCYFKVIHHFLLRGFDPTLAEGCSWDDFKKRFPAYVDVWRNDEERCREAWTKWMKNADDLMTEPVAEEPKFAVPILPATRSKHRWRYLKHGIPYKVRLCLDLKATKVNASTKDWKFRYKGLDDIAASVKTGDWLASVDISRFYLRLPAGPKLRQVQWVQDPDSYAFTSRANNKSKRKAWRQLQAIGFGLKTAPAWASCVSAELVRILKAAGVRVVGCFIDDILIAGKDQLECQRSLDKAIAIMRRLGIPANEKTVLPKSPSEGIVFLGVHIRTSDMRFTISEEHREYAMERVGSVLKDGIASKGDLASIAGVLNWISFVFVQGKPRRQIIYDAARLGASGRKTDKVVIEGPLQRQLAWWQNSLKSANWVGSRIWDMQDSPKTVLVQSDASGEDGWGACCNGFHIVGPWPEELQEEHMLVKEMIAVVITIALLSKRMEETVYGVAVDNTGVAFAVNKLSCRDKLTLRMLQQLTADLDVGGHTVIGAHIRRRRNEHTDAMSHALSKAMWYKIKKGQQNTDRLRDDGYWIFPLVVHKLASRECFSASFRMRRSLFAKLSKAKHLSTDRS